MITKHKYSYVLYTYNHERFVFDAVRSALQQDCKPMEILISDDCSEDSTYAVIQSAVASVPTVHNVILNRNETNLGINAHLTRSHELISGDVVIAAGGDDVSYHNRSITIISHFERYDPLLVHSLVNAVDLDGNAIPGLSIRGYLTKTLKPKLSVAALSGSLYVGASAAWSRQLFGKYGPISEELAFEDLILGFRALLEDRVEFINQPLIDYRVGEGLSTYHLSVDGSGAYSSREFRAGRIKRYRLTAAVMRQRLTDCHTYGLPGRHPIVLRIRRALRASNFALEVLMDRHFLGFPPSICNLARLIHLQLREYIAERRARRRQSTSPVGRSGARN